MSADHLSRLEKASPTISVDTPEIWRRLCEQTYRQFWARYEDGKHEEPESWKDKYFDLRSQEAKRLELVGAKLRNQRVEHEERKKEREVKLTDRIPPAKRQRTWGHSQPAKTLFEKTRSRTAQLQQSIYTRVPPPMLSAKNYSSSTRRLPASSITLRPSSTSSDSSSSSSAPQYGSRVTVNKVVVRKHPQPPQLPRAASPSKISNVSSINQRSVPPPSSPPSGKKDPMGTLFMPKHRAHSQLPLSSRPKPV